MSLSPVLQKAYQQEVKNLTNTKVPLVTVSATTREDIKGYYNLGEQEDPQDIVFSRAHYSMAVGVAAQAWETTMDPSKAWVFDPTNFVATKEWQKVQFTEFVGKTLARWPILKTLKDFVDQFGRSKLPILSSITEPLLSATQNVDQPVLSFHIAAGNILASQGKTVVQMVTDPHIRDEYLDNMHRVTMFLLVFDEDTKTDALEKAAILGKDVDPDRIIVTGPPIDPRITAAAKPKKAWKSGKLKLCLTTGGLGTNKAELRQLLRHLLQQLHHPKNNIELIVYAGTHPDIVQMVQKIAKQEKVVCNLLNTSSVQEPGKKLTQPLAKPTFKSGTYKKPAITLLHHPQIVDANELLIKHAFPWADGFITKPSGDMAYDAAAAGCFLLTLSEWGEWEHHIRERFETWGVARKAKTDNIVEQLRALQDSGWITAAMKSTQKLDIKSGAKKIIGVYEKLV